jgi:hypothetical protein
MRNRYQNFSIEWIAGSCGYGDSCQTAAVILRYALGDLYVLCNSCLTAEAVPTGITRHIFHGN